MFDKDVGPFQQKYVHLVEDIHSVYGTAKEVHGQIVSLCPVCTVAWLVLTCSHVSQFHAKGIQMLIDEFNYHVAYKRWDDTFNATPFKPK